MFSNHLGEKVDVVACGWLPGDLRISCRHPRQQLRVVHKRVIEVYIEVTVEDIVQGSGNGLSRPTIQHPTYDETTR